jgi:hypothetical protein
VPCFSLALVSSYWHCVVRPYPHLSSGERGFFRVFSCVGWASACTKQHPGCRECALEGTGYRSQRLGAQLVDVKGCRFGAVPSTAPILCLPPPWDAGRHLVGGHMVHMAGPGLVSICVESLVSFLFQPAPVHQHSPALPYSRHVLRRGRRLCCGELQLFKVVRL